MPCADATPACSKRLVLVWPALVVHLSCYLRAVFIINFFSDSPANKEWRVLLTYLEELEAKVRPAPCHPSAMQAFCKLLGLDWRLHVISQSVA